MRERFLMRATTSMTNFEPPNKEAGMMVMHRPGGTVNDLNIVLQWDTLLPMRLNNTHTCVWREPKDGDRANVKRWTLIKNVGVVLPDDSEQLDFPTVTLSVVEAQMTEEKGDPFEHIDIISTDEEPELG